MQKLRWTGMYVTVMGCAASMVWLAIAQSSPPPNQPEHPKRETVQGFEDVIRARKAGSDEKPEQDSGLRELALSGNNKEAWLRLLSAFNLKPPSRPEGWRFANYCWLRWRGALASRAGTVRRFRLMVMVATAYCPKGCCGSSHGRTATGRKAEYGVVAVDPKVIPLGTALCVDRYGFAIAADTGRKIKGARIDLCFPTHREALRFGRRKVKVLVIR